jgi:hypothetical protein
VFRLPGGGIVELQLAHRLVGALKHAEIIQKPRASSSAMISALIAPRSALNKMRKKYVFTLAFSIRRSSIEINQRRRSCEGRRIRAKGPQSSINLPPPIMWI